MERSRGPALLLLTPILIAIATALLMHLVGSWRASAHLDRTSAPLRHPGLQPALDRLARALDLPRLEVHVHEIEPVNGLAAPDGRIFLTRGFLKAHDRGAFTAEEIAGVIAHELGHVSLGHARRRMIDASGGGAIGVALAMTLGRIAPGVGVLAANAATRLLAARLSRQDEYEADEYAAALMIKAGLGAAPLYSLFDKLDRMSGAAGRPPAWLASHPPGRDRIAAIRALEARWRSA